MNHLRLSLLLGIVCFVAPTGPVAAKEEFPPKIARHLGNAAEPHCGTCHEYGKTGPDTLVTPFAWAMRARGLTGDENLLTALDRVASDAVDSDGDGATDVAELTAGTDPNSASIAASDQSDAQLGCSITGANATGLWLPVGVIVVGLLGVRFRRGRFRK